MTVNGRTDLLITWLERVENKVDALRDDVSVLKVKAGIYGGVVALVVSAVVAAIIKVAFG